MPHLAMGFPLVSVSDAAGFRSELHFRRNWPRVGVDATFGVQWLKLSRGVERKGRAGNGGLRGVWRDARIGPV